MSIKSDQQFVLKIMAEAKAYRGARMRLTGENHYRLLKLAGINNAKKPQTRLRRVVTILQRCEAAMAGIEQAMAQEVIDKLDPSEWGFDEALGDAQTAWSQSVLNQISFSALGNFVPKRK